MLFRSKQMFMWMVFVRLSLSPSSRNQKKENISSKKGAFFGISVLLNGMIMLAGTIICFTASETLMGMFTENPETVRLGTAALQIISIGFIPSAISVTASGALEGLSKGAQSLVISLLRYIIVIIPAAYLLCYFAGADAVWNAFWICEFITAVVVGIGIKYYRNRLLQ